ncbi:MAG: beta-propeller domain-containing protein [Candidatus Methanomethyliaceae archaeon]|nr:beta-propeller domain-containing protein [Candidatus Methanomethyliaceae archaeon]
MSKNLLGSTLIAVILGATIISGVSLITQTPITTESTLMRFSSYNQLYTFISDNTKDYGYSYYYYGPMLLDTMGAATRSSLDFENAYVVPSYSGTNVQVAGVDEADIVKTDGNYLYVISHDQVYILAAYPASEMRILCNFSFGLSNLQLFVDGNRLVVIGNNYTMFYENRDNTTGIFPSYFYFPNADIKVYDITNRSSPNLIRDITINGSVVASRMYNGYVYAVSSQPAMVLSQVILPSFYYDNQTEVVPPEEIRYADVPGPYNFVTILALNLRDDAQAPAYESFLADSVSTVYMSEDNLYLAVPVYPWRVLSFEGVVGQDSETARERTLLYRVRLSGLSMSVEAQGEVWGTVNNQFSMDESGLALRIATTEWGTNGTLNNLYVLDRGLNIVGSIEGLAPGERIYSARFVGERCYLVTFRQVDPFYVIDLSILSEPKVLGYLKIPGYSSYMHPYDDSHIIGVGMENNSLKLALFDVTNVTSPTELAKYVVDGSWSGSEALQEHKAFLFDRSKDLLVLPVYSSNFVDGKWSYWNGVFVFNLTLDQGFVLKGTVSHMGTNNSYDSSIQRSLYIDDALYTVSTNKVMANDLATLQTLNAVELP